MQVSQVPSRALVEQLEAELPDARWQWGACDGLFTPRPLGPLFDVAGQLGGESQSYNAGTNACTFTSQVLTT
jgi:hypothetical protein